MYKKQKLQIYGLLNVQPIKLGEIGSSQCLQNATIDNPTKTQKWEKQKSKFSTYTLQTPMRNYIFWT